MSLFQTSKIEGPISLFGSGIGICVAQSQRTFDNQGLITKKISALINDWENNIAYWEESKQSKALVGKCNSFHRWASKIPISKLFK